uniref:Putative m13 family peptidase n=1 Tax=Amblyomma americanum TaxID=6943 RepID=A0A0C9SEE3_AMBAM
MVNLHLVTFILLCACGPLGGIPQGRSETSETTASDDICSALCSAQGSHIISQGTQNEGIPPCENFYRHVCPKYQLQEEEDAYFYEESSESADSLKKELYQKLKGILQSNSLQSEHLGAVKGPEEQESKVVKDLAVELYNACKSDKGNKNIRKVIKAVNEMLGTFGLDGWPFTTTTHDTYADVLEKTGLRPLATIAAAPNERKSKYMLTMNIPWTRFSPDPIVLAEKEKHEEK